MLVPSGLTVVIMQLPSSSGLFAVTRIEGHQRICDS
jgi:hypothetical protein